MSECLWWKNGIIYQIYPRSFYDKSGDGIGDIPGIIDKLDYLQDIGIDGIWLSPIYQSPMFDFGYDISDYRAIDPAFGTLDDFKMLLAEAHSRKIRVIMDLVMNHTSHLHPWFVESRSSRDNPKRDWYIWHDGKKGKYPNNWMSIFGGRAWEWDESTNSYYLHSFLKEQPDVNWRNKELRKALYGEMIYWLDMGVDGFRLDVANYFVKDKEFRSNPFGMGPTPRPYDLQKHIYDINQDENLIYIKEIRSLLNRYEERMSVGEVFSNPPGNQILAASYLGNNDDGLHLSFDFSTIYAKWSAKKFSAIFKQWLQLIPSIGWPCIVLSNHDQVRALSRYKAGSDTIKRGKILAAMLLTIKGTPFIYYGEEIGMLNGKIRRHEIVDPVGKRYWPFNSGRDPERTPMQWDETANAGFTNGKPWLPIPANHKEVNVKKQLADKDSLLNFYRELIQLRRKSPALNSGNWLPVEEFTDVFAYFRIAEHQRMFVAMNFSSKKPASIVLEGKEKWQVVFSTEKKKGDIIERLNFLMKPYEITILEQT